jgi:hypothetical protein
VSAARAEFPHRKIYVDVAVPVAEMLEQLTDSGFYGTTISRTAEDLLLWALRAHVRAGLIKTDKTTLRTVRRIPDYPMVTARRRRRRAA